MKIVLVGYPLSQCIVPASKYLTGKYLNKFDITYLNYTGEINGWADYVANYLATIKDEHIIFALDDYLISDFIKMSEYYAAFAQLGSPDVPCVKLCYSTAEEHEEYPITTQYCLWNTGFLRMLLQLPYINNPWEFEIKGSVVFKKIQLSDPIKVLHCPCIDYFTNSSISKRWEGINISGLKQEDINFLKDNGYV